MRKLLFSIAIALAVGAAMTLEGCRKSATAALVDSLQTQLSSPFKAVEEHKGTVILTLSTQKDSIGLLERAEADIVVARHADLFRRVLASIKGVEGGQLRLTYAAGGTADRQDFDYDLEKLTAILDNPRAAISQAEEELQLLREAEL